MFMIEDFKIFVKLSRIDSNKKLRLDANYL